MRTHLRLIEKEARADSAEGAHRASQFLSGLDGVSIVSPVSLHPRGGYSVSIEIADGAFDQFVTKFESSGFSFVM
jgi:hypothetical protein